MSIQFFRGKKIPKIVKRDLSDEENEVLISAEVEKRLEDIKKQLKPEIKIETRTVVKEVPVYRQVEKPLNKILLWAVIILGIVVMALLGKNVLAQGYERIFQIENYYEAGEQMLGDSISNSSRTYLSRLRDVSLGTPSSGQVLTYNASSEWEASSSAAGLSSTLASGNIFIGNGAGTAEASSTSILTGLPYLLESASTSLSYLPNNYTMDNFTDGSDYVRLSTSSKTTYDALVSFDIGGLDATTTIVDANTIAIQQTSNMFKATWTTVKAFLKTYFDTVYLALAGGTMAGNIAMGSNDITGADEVVAASSTLGTITATTYNGYTPLSSTLTANYYYSGNSAGTAEATSTRKYEDKGFAVASSTYFFASGTSTIPLGYQFYEDTWGSLACVFQGGSSPTGRIRCGDGTNWMSDLSITGTMASTTFATNNVLQAKDNTVCQLEAVANSPDALSCRFSYSRKW